MSSRVIKISAVFLVLLAIFYLAYAARTVNTIPDRMLSFDPIFEFRYTKYFADHGFLPAWDELTYYVGRQVILAPFLFYVTGIVYWILKGIGWNLINTATLVAGLWGAAIVIPAFLLGRELSNKYGGLMAAALIGLAPQVLIRTFGSSYDTDQPVVFFITLCLFLSLRAVRLRTPESIFSAALGFTLFMLTWEIFIYPLLITSAGLVFYFALQNVFGKWLLKDGLNSSQRLKATIDSLKAQALSIASIFVLLILAGLVLNVNPLWSLIAIFGFAVRPEAQIVNISIAELQLVNLADINTWMLAMGRFVTGDRTLDTLVFLTFIALILTALYKSSRTDLLKTSSMIAIILVSGYTIIRGIRFTEFSSILFLAVVGAGFGYLVYAARKNDMMKATVVGFGALLAFYAISIGMSLGTSLGPDSNSNWENAWTFLRTQTPENSLVGTWWDPGHMITGLAERRVIGDGAHCSSADCLYGINTRITDLGKIFSTTDENEALKLLHKYQGTSSKIYWIASDDLVGKFQWLQYFGTGCDARSDPKCPLFGLMNADSTKQSQDGKIVIRNYGNIMILMGDNPVPLVLQGRNAALISELWVNTNGVMSYYKFDGNNTELISQLRAIEEPLGIRIADQTIPATIWTKSDFSYIAIIPTHLRNSVFTKQYFLDGEGLNHFKQVFRNEQVKIYEVIF